MPIKIDDFVKNPTSATARDLSEFHVHQAICILRNRAILDLELFTNASKFSRSGVWGTKREGNDFPSLFLLSI